METDGTTFSLSRMQISTLNLAVRPIQGVLLCPGLCYRGGVTALLLEANKPLL